MKTLSPTLIDIISPPANPWLQSLLKGKARAIPPWVQVVRFGDTEDDEIAPSATPKMLASANTADVSAGD